MKIMSLSHRLFLVTAIALLPAIIILVVVFVSLRENADWRLRDEASTQAKIATLELNRIVGGVESVLLAVSNTPIVRTGNVRSCDEYLERVVEVTPQLSDAAIADAEGNVVCRSSTNKEPISVADRDYFKAVQSNGTPVTGTYAIGRVSGRATLPIAMPMGSYTVWSGGVIAGGLDLAWLGARLKERDFLEGNALTVADRNGTILAREPFLEKFVGTQIPDRFLSLVSAPVHGTEEVVSQDGTRRMIGYYPAAPETSGLYVSAGIATDDFYAATRNLILTGTLIAVSGIAAAFALSLFTSNYFIRRPFHRLINTIEAWQQEDLERRTEMGAGLAEFGRAGRALDTLGEQLAAARAERKKAEAQRDVLSRELEHRVKNMFATVQAVARQSFRGNLDPSIRTFFQRIHSMATAHSALVEDKWHSAPIMSVVQRTIQPFTDRDHKFFSVDGPDLDLSSRATMGLSMALHELCTNASKYGALSVETGAVEIKWEVLQEGEGPTFQLCWSEHGGPHVAIPRTRGFGSAMIEQILSQQLDGSVSLDYRSEGLICRVSAALGNVIAQDDPENDEADLATPEENSITVQNSRVQIIS